MQVDSIKPMLKAPETKRLKLKCDDSLSNFGFKVNLRRYNKNGTPAIFFEKHGPSAADTHGPWAVDKQGPW